MAALSPFLRSVGGGQVMFFCPGCQKAHALRPKAVDGPGWDYNGNPDSPTFHPSILVRGKRRITDDEAERIFAGEKLDIPGFVCHSFITDGQIRFLDDCTHALAGQTVPLPPFQEEDA